MKNLLKKILVIINFGEPLPTKEDVLYCVPIAFVTFVILALVSIIEKM